MNFKIDKVVFFGYHDVIEEQHGADVLNEIDVISLWANVPVLISCKSGKMGSQQELNVLYELETVASRFVGKYAKKVLVTAKDLGGVYLERSKEMGIEVR